ncbi:glycoside hydrolase family 97 N-terminal domain-containing protein [Polaribacter sp. Q13]|uniref:glycoside hydrolase family 97 N-terminal domain-containing protein n=1 Tax=Polaribacter sp. Q13 TaxID=2806551 RepID=UPI00193BCCEA|nr:glycoside hydrolase family 97 N-terminal domain-containing protein [Polaribacter sp. Q13]QVY66605.1 glycoside hydrolase family 97 N-terminal domain-containing protein [Polaribacter sp. Q13]
MKHILLLLLPLFMACSNQNNIVKEVASPNLKNKIVFELNDAGQLFYSISSNNLEFLQPSALGFELKNKSLKNNFKMLSSEVKTNNSTWETVWGPRKTVKDYNNQLTLHLQQKETNILIDIIAKSFDDGIAFRYVFPKQNNLSDFVIIDELTEFNFKEDYKTWWNFADYDNYEKVYYNSPISQVGDSIKFKRRPEKEERSNMANTPTTIEVNDNLVVSIHEADLTDYAGMNLLNTLNGFKFKAHLTPWLNGDLVRASTPFQSPWRTIQIGKNPGDLVESDILMNLNPECAYEDTSFIETYKYIGI